MRGNNLEETFEEHLDEGEDLDLDFLDD